MSGKLVVLTICDGYGERSQKKGNAIERARTPNIDKLKAEWPKTSLVASGEAVGLPAGQQGNSEVGHLTIGAGRVINQPLTRINKALQDGSFFENPVLLKAFATAKEHHGRVHCIGLVSVGGVHSHVEHAIALAQMAKQQGCDDLVFDCFLDGRDTPPSSAADEIENFMDALDAVGVGRIASIGGRFYGMDRDKRWGRIEQAFNVIMGWDGSVVEDPVAWINDSYDADKTDEFIVPVAVAGKNGERMPVKEHDVIIFFNFRPDRMRELVTAFQAPSFTGFVRQPMPQSLTIVTFAEYDHAFHLPVAFPVHDIAHTLAEVVSAHALSQFHIAETEKYAHVTYFINGGREEPFPGEDRMLIPSPKVPTYDTFPEMSAYPLTNEVIQRIRSQQDALIIINYANADMVGHTGEMKATVRAIQSLDTCIGRVAKATLEAGGIFIMTADHGNAEEMLDEETGDPKTAHTTNPVPFIVCGVPGMGLRNGGGLSNVAPTVLDLLGLPHVVEMAPSLLLAQTVAPEVPSV